MQAQKRAGEMEWSGEAAPPQDGKAAAGLQEVEFAVELDAVADVQASVEIQQVDAAAQQDVLAIVDRLGPRIVSGRVGQRISSTS